MNLLTGLLLAGFSWIGTAIAQPSGAERETLRAIENLLTSPGEDMIDSFVDTKLSESYRQTRSRASWKEYILSMKNAIRGAGGVGINREGEDFHLVFSDGADATVVIRFDPGEPGSVGYLALQETTPAATDPTVARKAAVRQRVRALESLGSITSEARLDSFAITHLTEPLRSTLGRDSVITILRRIGRAQAASDEVLIAPLDNGEYRLELRGESNVEVLFGLENREPFRMDRLSVHRSTGRQQAPEAEVPPITWDNLENRLTEEAATGFSGTVLVVRNGQVVLHRGYGMANRERNRPNTTETIYAIGSTPIDFTRAAILHLVDTGKIALSDPITRFFPEAPDDKKTMTIEHLLNGRSGLPNFHHNPETDADYDLTWIDRDEAVRRILAVQLLFTPGSDRAHSHSAFTLLAAILEKASGQSYPRYLQEQFFEPLGMRHTGFYGPDSGLKPEQMAAGYGQKAADENIPLNWGPTSWLVMGSGGMVSNPGDMYRWIKGIHEGNFLSEATRSIYGKGAVLAGGSDQGFLLIYRDDPDHTVIFSSNDHTRQGDRASAIARALIQLVETN